MRQMDVPPKYLALLGAKYFVRLPETRFWATVVEKAMDGFFNGLLRLDIKPEAQGGKT